MHEFIAPHMTHLMSISFVNFKIFPLRSVLIQKNANFLPKALTKEQTKPSTKYCIFLVFVLNITPKFTRAGELSWSLNTTLQTFKTVRVLNTIQAKQVCKSSFRRLDATKIENRRAHETPDSSDVQHSLKELRKVFQFSQWTWTLIATWWARLNAAVVLLSARVASLNQLLN